MLAHRAQRIGLALASFTARAIIGGLAPLHVGYVGLLRPSQLNIGVPGASSLYGAPSIADPVSAETEQLPDFATHRPRMLWRML